MASTSSLGNASLANASSAQAFYTQFRASTGELLDQIAGVTTTEGLQDALQVLGRLSADLTRAVDSGVLPGHDQGVHKRRLEEVSAKLEVRRRQVEQGTSVGLGMEGGKKKGGGFAFKRKTPVSTAASPAAATTSTTKAKTSSQITPAIEAERKSTHLTISSLHNTTYHHLSNLIDHKDTQISLDLTNITSSLVDLRPLSSIHTILSVQLRTISNSILLLPPIEGSIMIHDLKHSLLAIPSCHQFRMHTAQQVAVELCTKRGSVLTVEGCTGIRFVAKGKGQGEEEAELRVQDFDDLINSEQLKGDAAGKVGGKQANFRVVKRKGKDLAERVQEWLKIEEGGSMQACIDKVLSEIDD